MIQTILNWGKKVKERFRIVPGRTLEIGSMNINGSIRTVFPDATEYIGVDMRDGNGVDIILHSLDIVPKFGKESFDTVLCCETLEHDLMPWITVKYMKEILKPGGILMITTPDYEFPYHGFPNDYYRFSKETYRDLFFVDMQTLDLSKVGQTICGLARKK